MKYLKKLPRHILLNAVLEYNSSIPMVHHILQSYTREQLVGLIKVYTDLYSTVEADLINEILEREINTLTELEKLLFL